MRQLSTDIYAIFGSTASGKSDYALKLAHKLDGEIINYDSMQVYADIPILTAQPSAEHRGDIAHHLYGFRSLNNHYSAGDFVHDVVPIILDVLERGKTPILVGGTGMYLKVLMEGLPSLPKSSIASKMKVDVMMQEVGVAYRQLQHIDPVYALSINCKDSQRIRRALEVYYESGLTVSEHQVGENHQVMPLCSLDNWRLLWLHKPRDLLYRDINNRFIGMVEKGVVDEVRRVVNECGDRIPRAHGLPELKAYLFGDITFDEALMRSQQVTRRYAKRQVTWAKHQLCAKHPVAVVEWNSAV